MSAVVHPDLLDYRENLRSPLLGSILLHFGIFAAAAMSAYVGSGDLPQWGTKDSLPGGTPITPVEAIPLPPKKTEFNPVADDTKSHLQKQIVPERTKVRPDPDAISLDRRKKKEEKANFDIAKYMDARKKMMQADSTPGTTGRAVSTPMYGKKGVGGVGVGDSNPFGNRFGYYAQQLQECVGSKWDVSGVGAQLRTAPIVAVDFEIVRNGTIRNVKVVEQSGSRELDFSCIRAVTDCNPFLPLPDGFERGSAQIEFKFQLKR
jgi:TonB family protein